MSSKSWLIDTKNSMLIVDEAAFPVNLGTTVREDSPEGSFRIIPFAGNNVLPTALGYRAFFSDSSILDIPPVPSDYCQHILYFQTPTFITIAIALCEEGIYVCNVSNTGTHVWEQVVATGYDPVSQVRHLATFAVVANKLCIYIQGMPRYYVVADIATIDNLVAQAPVIAGSDVDKVYNSPTYSYAVASVLPTFINMAGQIGLFRADNRLGFWDSDNAVAWSSATQLFDFTPSTETFAGITTFADVQGQISKVLGHGDGFVVYASRSITLVSPVIGSPERFAGQGILSETGVSYDTQIAVAQPDTIHYALTSAGLVRISSGTPEFVHTEVSDYVVENSQVVALNMLDGRYLFMTTTDDLKPAKVEVEVVQVVDHDNDGFFMLPTEEYTPGEAKAPVIHWNYDSSDTTVWNDARYRTNTGGPWHPSNWYISSEKIRMAIGLGTVIYALRITNIMNDFYPAPNPLAPNVLTFTAKLNVSLAVGEAFEILFFQDGEVHTETISTPGAHSFIITSPTYTRSNPGDLPVEEPPVTDPAFFHYDVLRVNLLSYVDGTSVITLDELYVDKPGASEAASPTDTLTYIVQGKSSLVQDGLANFSTTDESLAIFVQRNEIPLVPCFSGGDFKSTWMDSVNRVVNSEERLVNFLPGVGVFVDSLYPRFQTPYTLTSLGPLYTDPYGTTRVRIIDQAGDDILTTYANACDRLTYQLNQTATNVLASVPEVPDNFAFASTATPVTPYPSEADVPDIILDKDNSDDRVHVEDVAVPGTATVAITECAIILKAMVQDVDFISYLTGNIRLRKMYSVLFDSPFLDGSVTKNIAIAIAGPTGIFDLPGAGNWSKEAAEFRAHTTAVETWDGIWDGNSYRTITENPECRAVAGGGALDATPYLGRIADESLAIMNAPSNYGYDGGVGRFTLCPVTPFSDPPAIVANMRAKEGLSYVTYDMTSFTWPETAGDWTLDSHGVIGDRTIADFSAVSNATIAINSAIGPTGLLSRVGEFQYYYNSEAKVYATYKKGTETFTFEVRDLYLVVYNSQNPVDYLPYTPGSGMPEALAAVAALIPPQPILKELPDHTTLNVPLDPFSIGASISVRAKDWEASYTQHLEYEFVGGATEKDLFAIEVSGYGYFPGIGQNFRKTHNRNSSTTCPYPTDPAVTLPDDMADNVRGAFGPVYPDYSGFSVSPPATWPFPDPVPFPDTYALFRIGSWAPFYPTYKAAVFWDTQLNKWGRFNNEHKLVTTMMPVNREDAGIVPTVDLGLRGNSLREDGRLTVWSGDNKSGAIRYGRIGNYRLGWTTVTKVVIRFASPAVCNVLIEPSLDGASVDSVLTVGITVNGLNQVEIPFTARVKWFNILIEGDFNLVGIQYESEARGRR